MRKVVRRLLLVVALLVAVFAVLSAVGVVLFKDEPQWYHTAAPTTQQKEMLAREAENKLIDAQNWAALLRADAVRAQRVTTAPRAENSHVIELGQDELNALFDKWSVLYGWRSHFEKYLEDPKLILHDGKLILAGRVKQVGAVASFQFQPHIDDQGRLRLELVRVMGGRLPLPDAVWTTWRNKMLQSLRGHVPAWQASARFDPASGSANLSAVSVVLSRLLISVFEHKPAEAVLFLPLAERSEAIPVRVSECAVEEGKITLLVQPLTIPERQELLARIHSGDSDAQASVGRTPARVLRDLLKSEKHLVR